MQFLGIRRTISEKVLNSIALHHQRRPIIESGHSTNRGVTHKKRRSLLSVRNVVEQNAKSNNGKACKILLQAGVALRKTATCQANFLEPFCSSLILGGSGDERLSPSCHCQLIRIAATKGSGDLKDYHWKTSGCGAARGRKLGRRYRWSADDRGRRKTFPSEAVASTTSEEEIGQKDNCSRRYDAILVLAGGQVAGGGVPVWVERRLDKALDLQQRSNKHSNGGDVCKIVCLGGGTPHRAPILSSDGYVIHESTSCAEYLHGKGVPFAHLIKEWASYDTIGNGYFSLTQHVIPRRWKALAVVTSEFHMPRTRAAFEWIFGLKGAGLALQQMGHQQFMLVDGAVAAATGSRGQGFHLEFHSVPDQGDLDERIAQARGERERNSIKNLEILSQRIQSLEDFHEWFHTEHKAYNTEDQGLFGKEDKDDPALQSY